MAKPVYWRNGNYSSTITVNKQEKEFNANLTFRSGNISGNCEGISGRFSVKGTYTTVKPFSVKMEFQEAFGIPKIEFVGNHASDNTIFGTWSNAGVPGGDVWFRYKQLSPEEEERQQKKIREQQILELLNMGFEQQYAESALKSNGNDLEKAIDWLMQGNHLIDDNYDDNHRNVQKPDREPDEQKIQQLLSMGFSRSVSIEALKVSNCEVEQAIEWLFNQ